MSSHKTSPTLSLKPSLYCTLSLSPFSSQTLSVLTIQSYCIALCIIISYHILCFVCNYYLSFCLYPPCPTLMQWALLSLPTACVLSSYIIINMKMICPSNNVCIILTIIIISVGNKNYHCISLKGSPGTHKNISEFFKHFLL